MFDLIGSLIGSTIALAIIIYIWLRLEKKYFAKKMSRLDDLWEDVQKDLDSDPPIEITLGK